MIKNKTSIIVTGTTRDELRRIGRKEQTYDQVINELIKTKQNLELEIKKTDLSNQQSHKLSVSKSDYS
jgi:lipoate synthase